MHAVAGAPALADDEGRHDGRVGAERDTGHAAVRARRQAEEVDEHPEPPGRVLVDGEHEEPALVERLQHPARAGALADHARARPAAKLAEPAVDERIGDRAVHHVDRVAALPVREDEQLPVAEVPAQGEDAGAPLPADRLLPPRLVLEADHVPQLLVREPRQMGQLGGHVAQVQEGTSQDAPPLTERSLGERDAQVRHADPPVGHVERVGQERAQLAQAERQGERQGSEQPHHDAQRQVLRPRAHPPTATLGREPRPRAGPPPRRGRSRHAPGRYRHGRFY